MEAEQLDLASLPCPEGKFKLGMKIGGGVRSDVFEAVTCETGVKVAVKVVEWTNDSEGDIRREYHVYKKLSGYEGIPNFHGIYLKQDKDNVKRIWLVLELCDGGTAADFTRKMKQTNQDMNELHTAHILNEVIKAVIHLHENNICHGDVRGDNVLLTSRGQVKLADFGLSRPVGTDKKIGESTGSPGWMAPEMLPSQTRERMEYDAKIDVWAIGITAIELGDGQAPFETINPARALFQIANEPPPTLSKLAKWSQNYNDFISECLVKNADNRPFAQELLQHTFFQSVNEDKNFLGDFAKAIVDLDKITICKQPEIQIANDHMKIQLKSGLEKILHEDLACLPTITEDSVLSELRDRFNRNEFQTFVGDVLLVLNPNKTVDQYGDQHHSKYRFKAKSQNAPHIYAVAESAYRDVFHHEKPQRLVFAGETGAGKTVNMMHAVDHLLHLGQGLHCVANLQKALSIIHALGNASTPHNSNSTRHVLQTNLTFTDTRKVSGAIFRLYQLEKERVTASLRNQSNFHIFYYLIDMLEEDDQLLLQYHLDRNTQLKYLQSTSGRSVQTTKEYETFEKNLQDLQFDPSQISSIKNVLVAILLCGQIEFGVDDGGNGVLATEEVANNVASLLGLDRKRFSWALLKYCVITRGEAVMKRSSKDEAEEAKQILARGLYARLTDWIVNTLNEKLSVSRIIYGDKHLITLLDFYGFEVYKRNSLSHLFVNTVNEQMQYHYNRKLFAWDKATESEEGIVVPDATPDENKVPTIDLIMSKPEGLLWKIDEATRDENWGRLIDMVKKGETNTVFAETTDDFSVRHYAGKVTYEGAGIPEKNKDFLPPELIETLRTSTDDVVKRLFSSLVTKSGNVSANGSSSSEPKTKQGVATNSIGHYSQSRQMRTASTTFRSACFNLLQNLTTDKSGFHFVRCIRTDLAEKPGRFHTELVVQQIRALAVVDTAKYIQQGYSYSMSHGEFFRRYKFLAFDSNENLEETKDNCRLLLLRLKLEGWKIGTTKVYLKYFNKDYLTRLYELELQKVIKVQAMMRQFIARRRLLKNIQKYQGDADGPEKAAEEREKTHNRPPCIGRINGTRRKKPSLGTLTETDELNEEQKNFIKPWCKQWKKKSIFQILILKRVDRLQVLANFCLQIHMNNGNALRSLSNVNYDIDLNEIESKMASRKHLPWSTQFISQGQAETKSDDTTETVPLDRSNDGWKSPVEESDKGYESNSKDIVCAVLEQGSETTTQDMDAAVLVEHAGTSRQVTEGHPDGLNGPVAPGGSNCATDTAAAETEKGSSSTGDLEPPTEENKEPTTENITAEDTTHTTGDDKRSNSGPIKHHKLNRNTIDTNCKTGTRPPGSTQADQRTSALQKDKSTAAKGPHENIDYISHSLPGKLQLTFEEPLRELKAKLRERSSTSNLNKSPIAGKSALGKPSPPAADTLRPLVRINRTIHELEPCSASSRTTATELAPGLILEGVVAEL